MPLPPWASDLRGALLALAALAAADFGGLFRCRPLLAALTAICAAGVAFSVGFYRHTTRTVFNRRPGWQPQAYWHHFMMTRPLEAMWRFATSPLRALPDFLVLGEVRTGSTTLAAHLRQLGCIGPFSPWIHPLATEKESFYFAGHYWGMMHPAAYRMCFPLKLTLWVRRHLLGQPSPVFDACASYLNAPWAAALLWSAVPDAALVVLLRDPCEQHSSWWHLEVGAHQWARGMGMGLDFAEEGYPPRSFSDAQRLSRSDRIRAMYLEGEHAGKHFLRMRDFWARLAAAWLPQRLLPFPGGQLAAFAHMGRYADNIRRYTDLFGNDRLVVVETAELALPGGLAIAARRLARLVPSIGALQDRAEKAAAAAAAMPQRLNASPAIPSDLQPTAEDLAELREFYREPNARLFALIGKDLGWNTAKEADWQLVG